MTGWNKEKLLFVVALLGFGALAAGKLGSVRDDRVERVRPRPVEPLTLALPEIRTLAPDEQIWSTERRDVFTRRREVEDLPPVDLPLPPLRPRPLVAPLLDPPPPPGRWGLLADRSMEADAPPREPGEEGDEGATGQDAPGAPDPAAMRRFLDALDRRVRELEGNSVEGEEADRALAALEAYGGMIQFVGADGAIDLVGNPEAREAMAGFLRAAGPEFGLDSLTPPASVRELLDEIARERGREGDREGGGTEPGGESPPLEATLDRLFRGSEVIYGRILNEDPFDLLGEELPESGRFRPRPGARIRISIHDPRTGRRIGSATYRSEGIDGIALAGTLENRIRLRRRRIRPGDLRARLDLASWCRDQGALDAALEEYRGVLSGDVQWNRRAALGIVEVLGLDHRWDDLFDTFRDLDRRGIEDAWMEARHGELLERFDLEAEAEAAFRRCIALDPGSAAGWCGLAGVLRGRGALEEGLEAARAAVRSAAADPDPGRLVEAARLEAAFRVAGGDLEGALESLERTASDPRVAALLAPTRAVVLGLLGRLAEGLALLADPAAGGDDPGAGSPAGRYALLVRGVLRARTRDLAGARADLEEARERDPVRDFWPSAALGYVSLVEGSKEAAFEEIGRAVRRRPGDPYARYLLARFHLASGNDEGALEELERARAAAPESTEILAEIGFAHLRGGEPEAALPFLAEAARRGPRSPGARVLLGLTFLGLGRTSEARAEIEAALDLEKSAGREDPQTLLARAYLEYQGGDEDGVYRAMGALMRVTELLADRAGDPLALYAARYLGQIEENREKCRWDDGFNRLEVRRGWELDQGRGIQIRLVDGALRFEGTQRTRGEEITWIERPMEYRGIVRMEASIQAARDDASRAGISVVVRGARGSREVLGGIYFGKEPRGRLAYRTVDRGKPGDWEILDDAWPKGGAATLAVESQDPEAGLYRLLLDGRQVARDVRVPVLRKPRSPPRIGIFATASLGTTFAFVADDVRVILRKGGKER